MLHHHQNYRINIIVFVSLYLQTVSSLFTGIKSNAVPNNRPLYKNTVQDMSKLTESLERCNSNTISWEPEVANRIALKSREREDEISKIKRPYVVGIIGIPGSGKSTSSSILSEILRTKENISNIILPMDGYHYPISKLQQFPNAKDAIYRRGAPDTFDSESLYNDLHTIVNSVDKKVVHIPGFDHAKGDPEPNKYTFNREEHDIVICEGLYLLLNHKNWCEKVQHMFDMSIFIDADIDKCMSRLKERNKCIPGYTPEEIEIRVDNVDRKNAILVQTCKEGANVLVQSQAKI